MITQLKPLLLPFLVVFSLSNTQAQPGTLDSLFGVNGIATFQAAQTFSLGLRSVYEQPDGKILLAGHGEFEGSSNTDFMVYRFLKDGGIDESFALGNQLGTPGVSFIYWGFNSYDYLSGIGVQEDGKIVFSGTGDIANYFVQGRLDENGDPDYSFGDNPSFYTQGYPMIGPGNIEGNGKSADMELDALDRVVIAGQRLGGYAVMRLQPDGEAYDSTFSGVGWVEYTSEYDFLDRINDMTIDDDGNIWLCGQSFSAAQTYDVSVLKLLPDGTIDQSFGDQGWLLLDIENSPTAVARKMTIDEEGRVLLCGQFGNIPQGDNIQAFVARLLPDGNLDEGFGNGGIYTLGDENQYYIATGIAIDTAENIVVGGGARPPVGFTYNPMAFRLTPEGDLDTNFAVGGVLVVDQLLGFVDDAIMLSDDRFLLGGVNSDGVFLVKIKGGEEEVVVGTEEAEGPVSLKVYPNPTRDGKVYFNKEISGVLVNQLGQKVLYVENENWVDLSGLPRGVYYLRGEVDVVEIIRTD